MTLPPGPRLPAVAQGAWFLRRPVEFLERMRDRYGEAFTASFPGIGTVVYVADPETVRAIYTGNPDTFQAGIANAQLFEPVVGRSSLLTLDGSAHLAERRLLLPPFHGERIQRFADAFAAVARREIATWPRGRPFSLLAAMRRITMEAILRAVLGVDERHRLDRYRTAILRLDRLAGVVMPLVFLQRDLGPLSPWRRFLAARDAVDRLVYEEIETRRAGAGDRDDVLSLLLAARHEDGSPMSDSELRDEIFGLLAAGYETSSTALGWAFERVLRHPAVLDRLLDDPADERYLDAVVNETMRVRSPVTDSTRVLSRATAVAGHELPAGTQVVVALPLLHLRPENWERPHEFVPERFLDGGADPYTFIPFGGGVRRCPGAPFAQLEMKVVLRTVLDHARFSLPSPQAERQRLHHVTVVPSRGSRVVLSDA